MTLSPDQPPKSPWLRPLLAKSQPCPQPDARLQLLHPPPPSPRIPPQRSWLLLLPSALIASLLAAVGGYSHDRCRFTSPRLAPERCALAPPAASIRALLSRRALAFGTGRSRAAAGTLALAPAFGLTHSRRCLSTGGGGRDPEGGDGTPGDDGAGETEGRRAPPEPSPHEDSVGPVIEVPADMLTSRTDSDPEPPDPLMHPAASPDSSPSDAPPQKSGLPTGPRVLRRSALDDLGVAQEARSVLQDGIAGGTVRPSESSNPESSLGTLPLLADLRARLDATPAILDDVWAAFEAVCADPTALNALEREDGERVLALVVSPDTAVNTASPTSSQPAPFPPAEPAPDPVHDRLAFYQARLGDRGWTHATLFALNDHIRRIPATFPRAGWRDYLAMMRSEGVEPNRDTYGWLLVVFGEQGDGEGAEHVLAAMVEAGFAPDRYSHLAVIVGYVRSGDPDAALAYSRQMQAHGIALDVYVLTTLMAGFRAKNPEASLALFDEMRAADIAPTPVTYNVLLGVAFVQKRVETAEAIFAHIRDEENAMSIATFNIMMTGYAANDKIDLTLEYFEDMLKLGMEPNIYTYRALIFGCMGQGLKLRAVSYLNNLLRSGLEIDRRYSNLLIYAFAQAGEFEKALECFQQMFTWDSSPDAETYTILMAAYGKHGDFPKAIGMFERMRAAGVSPTGFTYRSLIRIYLANERFEDAKNAFKLLRSTRPGPSAGTYIQLIKAACDAGDLALAETFFLDMEDAGVSRSYPVYDIIASAHARRRDLDSALRWVGLLRSAGHSPRVGLYENVVAAATFSPQPQLAFDIYREMLEDGIYPTDFTFNHLILAAVHDPNPDTVDAVLADMRLANVPFTDHTYGVFMFYCSRRRGSFELAWQLWEEYIARARAAAAEAGEAQITILPAVAKTVLRTCATHKKLDRARQAWAVIRESGCIVDFAEAHEFTMLAEYWAVRRPGDGKWVEVGQALTKLLEGDGPSVEPSGERTPSV
ncbi:hypothetical protein BDK51DRAFT_44613 [Blyttiomyces helicus]|uniref:Pentacotripeptide-repeat region of PRORP domain-containing protein n=1 Tax=Blyttiomyces helicus TaxID=388810 RepID=A0A4P9WKU0_9FUNG|nr:hypothetical protein BDK51DRAFT_44613 [Blyttiomyces helicus]|eukprot:RKO92198.1 hypothetical protein BDK51DRAFT_44613 [Blyttiomyces helicus]